MMIYACSNAYELGEKVASELGVKYSKVECSKFPDGELYVRLMDEPEEPVVVFQSGYPKQNDALIELILTLDALHEHGANATVVLPYYPYARQDKIFRKGEALSARAIGRMLAKYYVEQIITVDAHFYRRSGWFREYGVKIWNVSASKYMLASVLRITHVKWPVVVAPDFGAIPMVQEFNAKVMVFRKRRADYAKNGGEIFREVEKMESEVEIGLEGKDVIVLDDMISTGGTMARAIMEVRKRGAKRVYAVATHGLFVKNAAQRIRSAGATDIFVSDTIKSEYSRVSVAPLLAKTLADLVWTPSF